jgi:Calcineurin-like phosphoesterase
LNNAKIQEKTVWLDIRGNHDNFNVPEIGKESKFDYFTNYSMQGRLHRKSYAYDMEKGENKYSFIGIDASLVPGPKRPFNFIGILSANETQHVIDLAEKSQKWGTNHIIWFAHYPTSCILGKGFGSTGVRDLLSKFSEGIVYLCGHFHTMGGLIPNMYTLQNGQLLELEVRTVRRLK